MVIEDSRPIVAVARQLGVQEATLGKWVQRHRLAHADGAPSSPATGEALVHELEQENRELEREVRDLRMELDFLKKAAAYFAQDRR